MMPLMFADWLVAAGANMKSLKQVAAPDRVGDGQVQVSLVTPQTIGTITVYAQ